MNPSSSFPWTPLHLVTRAAGRVSTIFSIGHTRANCWVECDVVYPEGARERHLLHPLQITTDSNESIAQKEFDGLQCALRLYQLSHGDWTGARWRPHDDPQSHSTHRHRKAWRRRNRDHFRPPKRTGC